MEQATLRTQQATTLGNGTLTLIAEDVTQVRRPQFGIDSTTNTDRGSYDNGNSSITTPITGNHRMNARSFSHKRRNICSASNTVDGADFVSSGGNGYCANKNLKASERLAEDAAVAALCGTDAESSENLTIKKEQSSLAAKNKTGLDKYRLKQESALIRHVGTSTRSPITHQPTIISITDVPRSCTPTRLSVCFDAQPSRAMTRPTLSMENLGAHTPTRPPVSGRGILRPEAVSAYPLRRNYNSFQSPLKISHVGTTKARLNYAPSLCFRQLPSKPEPQLTETTAERMESVKEQQSITGVSEPTTASDSPCVDPIFSKNYTQLTTPAADRSAIKRSALELQEPKKLGLRPLMRPSTTVGIRSSPRLSFSGTRTPTRPGFGVLPTYQQSLKAGTVPAVRASPVIPYVYAIASDNIRTPASEAVPFTHSENHDPSYRHRYGVVVNTFADNHYLKHTARYTERAPRTEEEYGGPYYTIRAPPTTWQPITYASDRPYTRVEEIPIMPRQYDGLECMSVASRQYDTTEGATQYDGMEAMHMGNTSYDTLNDLPVIGRHYDGAEVRQYDRVENISKAARLYDEADNLFMGTDRCARMEDTTIVSNSNYEDSITQTSPQMRSCVKPEETWQQQEFIDVHNTFSALQETVVPKYIETNDDIGCYRESVLVYPADHQFSLAEKMSLAERMSESQISRASKTSKVSKMSKKSCVRNKDNNSENNNDNTNNNISDDNNNNNNNNKQASKPGKCCC